MGQVIRIMLRAALVVLLGAMSFTCSDKEVIIPTSPELEFPDNQLLVSVNRTSWTLSARPVPAAPDIKRAGILWHTPVDGRAAGAVLPGWTQKPANAPIQGPTINTFRVIFRPLPGQPSWAGIVTRFIHPINPDSVKGIELRALGDHGIVHFDVGYIDDDVTGDGSYFSEDRDYNGVVDESEDVGLDGLPDETEPGYDPVSNPDPNGDDFYFMGEGRCPVRPDACDSLAQAQDVQGSEAYYRWLNGTEGNRADLLRLGEPDREWSGQGAETRNEYFSVRVDLSQNTFVAPGSQNADGWKTIRIPADSSAIDAVVGETKSRSDCWRDINRIRIWFESDGSSGIDDTIEIAAMYFLQDVRGVDDSGAIVVHEYARDYEFQSGRVFDLGYPGEFGPCDTVINVRMFESNSAGQGGGDPVDCLLRIYPDSVDYGVTPPSDPYETQRDSLSMTELTDFQYYGFTSGSWRPHVVLEHARSENESIGCWLVVRRYSGDGSTFLRQDTVGNVGDDGRYVLKSLRAAGAIYSPAHMTWDLMWRNVYQVRPRTTIDNLDLRIFKGPVGTEGDISNLDYQVAGSVNEGRYIQILGLDQYNVAGQRLPDGRVDDRVDIIRPDEGMVILPDRRPFDSDTVFEFDDGSASIALTDRVPELYDGSSAEEQVLASAYYLSSSWTSHSPVIRLGRTNIQEGSERVWFRGRLLARGTDYNIDYRYGILVLLGPEADYVSAGIQVTYLPRPYFP